MRMMLLLLLMMMMMPMVILRCCRYAYFESTPTLTGYKFWLKTVPFPFRLQPAL
jgi:hypothetical protein